MKKIIALFLAAIMLAGCGINKADGSSDRSDQAESINQSDSSKPDQPESEGTSNAAANQAESKSESDSQYDVTFCDGFSYEMTDDDENTVYYGAIGYTELAESTGLKINAVNILEDGQLLKILAGDSDVDIYIISPTLARTLKDKSIYTPIESQTVKSFNSGCFDYIRDMTLTGSGETVLMPVYMSVSAIAYPKSAAEEIGFTEEELLYYDSFIELVKNNRQKRASFSAGFSLFAHMESQYEHFYCDFENGEFDYLTDEYKKIYKTLDGWKRYGESPAPTYFVNPYSQESRERLKDPENVLFYDTSLSAFMKSGNDIEAWRASPMPRMSDRITGNFVLVNFAYINPYSKNKEAAVKALETLAENFYDMPGIYPYSIMKKDKSEYPESFRTDTELFDDFYNIAKNGFLQDYALFTAHNDIEEYQNGRATLEKAIEMYQREVNIWLNE